MHLVQRASQDQMCLCLSDPEFPYKVTLNFLCVSLDSSDNTSADSVNSVTERECCVL
jgi:hypothetical protein